MNLNEHKWPVFTALSLHERLYIPILPAMICSDTAWPPKLFNGMLKLLDDGLGSIVVTCAEIRYHSRKAIDSSVNDNLPTNEFMVTVNVPERIDPRDFVDATFDSRSRLEIWSIAEFTGSTKLTAWDLNAKRPKTSAKSLLTLLSSPEM